MENSDTRIPCSRAAVKWPSSCTTITDASTRTPASGAACAGTPSARRGAAAEHRCMRGATARSGRWRLAATGDTTTRPAVGRASIAATSATTTPLIRIIIRKVGRKPLEHTVEKRVCCMCVCV